MQTLSRGRIVGVPMMVELFDQIGALALLAPGCAALGAAWLGTTMFFAVLTHFFILVWLRRDQLAAREILNLKRS
jgi:hypothetical protein